MSANRLTCSLSALAIGLLACRVDVEWSKISPDDDPHAYSDALEALRLIALPQLNAARTQCDIEVDMEWAEILGGLLLVESSATSYKLTFDVAIQTKFEELVVEIDKAGERWSATPHPCKLARSRLDLTVPLFEDDRYVQMGLLTLIETTAARCAPAEIFIPIGVLDAVMIGGTLNEVVKMHVLGAAGPHRVHFEFSGLKARLLSSDVPVCKLAKGPPPQDSSFMQIWGGLSLSEVRTKRVRRITNEIYKKARMRRSLNVLMPEARLPKYTGQLETEFHWAEVAPECFGFGPEVQDQGSCGACSMFATLGALSDRHCLAYGKPAMSWPDGGLKRFSVQDFLSCYLGEEDGCKGVKVEDVIKALMEKPFSFERDTPYFSKCYLSDSEQGLVHDYYIEDFKCSDYSHLPDHPANEKPCSCWFVRTGAHPTCNETVPRQHVQIGWGSIRAFGDLSLPKRVELIMRYIREGGPVAAEFAIWDDFKPFVARAPDLPYYRHDVSATWRGKHCVIITGWGVSNEGKPYWWARNSWGTKWGTKGYFKIARGSNSVGFENNVVFSIVKEEFMDPNEEVLQGAESSYATFGIRRPWSHDMVPHWGKLVPGEVSEGHLFRFVPSNLDVGPVIARFDIRKARVKKDVYVAGDHFTGQFQLLAVEIPFECSEPCALSSSDTYPVVGPAGVTVYEVRLLEVKLDDESWSRGVLTVYIGKDDPLQGKSNGTIKVTIESRLFKEMFSQFKRQGVEVNEVKDWYKLPWRTSYRTIYLPQIPFHKGPDPSLEPILPLQLSLETKPVNSFHHKYLRLALVASEPSVYYVRVSNKATKEVLLASFLEQSPDRWAWLHIGGSTSIGGSSFKYFFFPGHMGYGRTLSIEVEATCETYARPVRTTSSVDFQWPHTHASVALSVFLLMQRAWEEMFGR